MIAYGFYFDFLYLVVQNCVIEYLMANRILLFSARMGVQSHVLIYAKYHGELTARATYDVMLKVKYRHVLVPENAMVWHDTNRRAVNISYFLS